MFCVLNVKRRDNTFFEKIFGCLMKDRYDVQTIPVYKGAPFYIMDVSVGKRGIRWENVISQVGRCAGRMVATECIDLPQGMNLGFFESNVLYDKMMKNTFLRILGNNLKNNTVSVSVSDDNGKYTDFTKKLTKYASTLAISTLQKEKYYDVCEEITENSGLCPVLTDSDNNATVRINANKNVMTIICENNNLNIFDGSDFRVPEMYEKLLPERVAKYDFYSALYELCGVFSLEDCFFDIITVNKEKKCVSDIHFS